MGESRDDPTIYWVDPEQRGVLPLDAFHIPRRLRRTLRQAPFDIKIDTAFSDVITACAETSTNRPNTWINGPILGLYRDLHARGNAHSVECWRDGVLVGGLYGVSIGGVFFGESMFSRTTDASKAALVRLIERLRRGGYTLLDTQFVTEHLARFGAIEVPRAKYLKMLAAALRRNGDFGAIDREPITTSTD